MKIYSDGDIRVAVAGYHWTFNPAVLVKEASAVAQGGQPGSPQVRQATAYNELQGILQPSSSTSPYALQRQQHECAATEENGNVQQPLGEIGIVKLCAVTHLWW